MTYKVIDTFSFNGEWIVNLRLKYLDPVVDEFVIVESWQTHSGERKEKLFSEIHNDWFVPFIHKVKWLIIEEFTKLTHDWLEDNKHHSWMIDNHEHWHREMQQRDFSQKYLQNKYCNEPFIVLVTDVDEIPKRDFLEEINHSFIFNQNKPIFMEMEFFYYNFQWRKKYNWYKAYILPGHLIDQTSFSMWRVNSLPSLVLRSSGWHFSYFMTTQELVRKLRSFAHRECDKEHLRNNAHIKECFTQGIDLFSRGEDENLALFDALLPQEFSEFKEELTLLQQVNE